MCGITGFFTSNNTFTEKELHNMTAALVHRGPDAEGYFSDGTVGLGHRRLSIIDLSAAANQPMISHSGNYVIAYNGEVYNFNEIREDIGLSPRTASDTEVILEAFEKYGTEFIHTLNGMFAIAIYDKQEKQLYLFRDRIGIKPLFYFHSGTDFAFASEIKALEASDHIRSCLSINKQAVSKYLYLGFIPEPDTIYKNIYKFPAGSYAVVTKEKITFNKYWDPEQNVGNTVVKDLHEAKAALNDLLTRSVKYRLISDVPYGTFLSGGTDSSLVTAIAQKVSSAPIKTFSIGFKEEKFNEAGYAKQVAEYLQTDHHEFIVSHNEAIQLVDEITGCYDEPYSDSSAIPTMIVSKLARKHVTMALSGDGGDETFFGYGSYKWADRLKNPVIKLSRVPLGWMLSGMSNRMKRAAKVFQYPDPQKIKSHIFSQEQYLFSSDEITKLLTQDYNIPFGIDEHFKDLNRELTVSEQQALFDLKYYLKDDLLVKTDRAGMKYSLETRVPMLDHNVVEYALNISPDLKIRGGIQKYILKQLLFDHIPEKYFNRQKWGFAIPLSKWLKNELKYLIDDYLNKEVTEQYGMINFQYLDKLVREYLSGKDFLYNRLWLVIILHRWLQYKL